MTASSPAGHELAAAIGKIDAATDEAQLQVAVDQVRTAAAAENRTRPTVLAAAWSDVLLHGVAAGVRLTAAGADWTWFVSGSVGRGEATPGSDVETMVALGDDVDDDDKVDLLTRAADVHDLLERCGIRGDANGVLASRPRFCRRVRSWAEGIDRWTTSPRDDRGVVMTGLMADSAGLPSRSALPGDALRSRVVTAAGRNYPVRQAMLQDATAVRASVPSRLRLLVKNADEVDVKLAALDPVVKIARWAALSAGSAALTTPTRFEDAAAAGVLDADDASSLSDCFGWLLRFRWQTRAAALLAGRPVDDVVSLSEMAPQDRASLRSVAREVAGIGRKLTYLASTSAFH